MIKVEDKPLQLTRIKEEEFDRLSQKFGFQFTSEEQASLLKLINDGLQDYNDLLSVPETQPVTKYPRNTGYSPSSQENPYGAWYIKTTVKGAKEGKLANRTIVLKDNVCLAGVPMMNGCSILEGYVPDRDATIVTRILDAGGTVAGKAHCESLGFSVGSDTCDKGPVLNPHKKGFSSGGSSSGSAVLVATEEVNMAVGTDQGGSIRIPASFCGVYGLKPTFGLVPYTGIMSTEPTLDHVGPLTRSVFDNALLLETIAGSDGVDSRQQMKETGSYISSIKKGVEGFRIGVVKEGFSQPHNEAVVNKYVKHAAQYFSRLGATVEEASIPEHSIAPKIFKPILVEGSYHTMMLGNGFGFGRKDLYLHHLMKAQGTWRKEPGMLSKTLKLSLLEAEYMRREHGGFFYAKAQNLSRQLKQSYDSALQKYDLLLMPTTPMRAPPLPDHQIDLETYIHQASGINSNACPFNVTGHPALNVPCGQVEDLPIGMMLIGKYFDEGTIYRAAYAFEQSVDWKKVVT
jgi:amidase